jgi:hypothetical protein
MPSSEAPTLENREAWGSPGRGSANVGQPPARIERCDPLWDSHLAQNFKDGSIAEAVYIPVPRFQQLLRAVIDGRHASSNRRHKPLPTMEKINEWPPVHKSILTPLGNLGTDVHRFCELELGVQSVPGFPKGRKDGV